MENKRLTKKVENEERYIANNFKREKGERLFAAIDNYNAKVYSKLGQLEDLMEKYGIESIEELEDTIQIKKALELAFGKNIQK